MGSGISSDCKNKNKSSQNLSQCYELGIIIGRGGFATVFEGHPLRNRQHCPKIVAIKAIMISSRKKNTQIEIIQNEIEIMSKLKHPIIIDYYESFIEPNAGYIVMERFEGVNLLHHLIQSKHISEKKTATIISQLAKALEYLHVNHIVHRDIKLENILLGQDCNGKHSIKLTDFGLATKFTSSTNLNELCGTPIYAAPEMLLRSYSLEIDMWSLGVLMYTLLCGYPPFYQTQPKKQKLFQSILIAEYKFHKNKWENVSDASKSLIAQLLVVDPKTRLCASDVLSNTWIQSNTDINHDSNSSQKDVKNSKVPSMSDIDVPQDVESWYCSYYESALVTSNGHIVGTSKVENLSQNSVCEIIQIVENSQTV